MLKSFNNFKWSTNILFIFTKNAYILKYKHRFLKQLQIKMIQYLILASKLSIGKDKRTWKADEAGWWVQISDYTIVSNFEMFPVFNNKKKKKGKKKLKSPDRSMKRWCLAGQMPFWNPLSEKRPFQHTARHSHWLRNNSSRKQNSEFLSV